MAIKVTFDLEGIPAEAFVALRWEMKAESHAELARRLVGEAMVARGKRLSDNDDTPPPKADSGTGFIRKRGSR